MANRLGRISMKVNEYLVMTECVENGVNRGYNRAFKYTEEPSEDVIKDLIYNEVMSEICQYFNFDFNEEN